MSQHDQIISNDTGANVRADLNNALAALVSNSSGATEPTTTYAFQFWADTTTGLLKIRNAANSDWVTIGTLASSYLGLLPLAGGTLTGAVLAAVGAAGAPSIAFSGDSDTGVYWVSANTFGLVVNGAEVLRLQADPEFKNTTAVKLPVGTTAERPASPTAGHIRYNSTSGKFEGYAGGLWKDVGGGGGGAGFQWREMGGNSALASEENSERVYLFSSGLAQELYASVKVPQSYAAGTQIKLYISAYSPSSSNTILLQSQCTLIRAGTDAFDSTTNQRTSTNAALTNTVANMLREFELDLTDSSGAVNGVAVAAGSILKIKLYRGSDSDTADIRMIPNSTDIKFS